MWAPSGAKARGWPVSREGGRVDVSEIVRGLFAGRDPALVLVTAVGLMVGGGLVIVFPALLAWGVGLVLLLGGVATLGTLLSRTEGDHRRI